MPFTVQHLAALIAALSFAFLECFYRHLSRRQVNPWALSIFTTTFAGLLILVIMGPPSLFGITPITALLLLLSGVLWSIFLILDILAYTHLDASVNALLYTARFLLLNLVGAFIFNEPLSGVDWLGITLIAISICWGVEIHKIRFERGFIYRVVNVLCGVVVITNDKFLVPQVGVELVILSGFLLPGILLLFFSRLSARRFVAQCNSIGLPALLAATLLFAIGGYLFTFAFGTGSLALSLTLVQTKVLFIFIISALLLHEREQLLKRGAASVLCVLGVAIVAFL
jgi:drug/metabolite transporter (DMT)-like permease